MIHNNLKTKAKLILKYYVLEMNIEDSLFFMRISKDDYLKEGDKQKFLFSEFRYLATQSGLI